MRISPARRPISVSIVVGQLTPFYARVWPKCGLLGMAGALSSAVLPRRYPNEIVVDDGVVRATCASSRGRYDEVQGHSLVLRGGTGRGALGRLVPEKRG